MERNRLSGGRRRDLEIAGMPAPDAQSGMLKLRLRNRDDGPDRAQPPGVADVEHTPCTLANKQLDLAKTPLLSGCAASERHRHIRWPADTLS